MASHLHNYMPRGDLENATSKIMSAKSFGAAKDQSAVKKKALVDVANTIHKKVLSSALKPSRSTGTAGKKKDLMKVFGDKENVNANEKLMKPKETKHTHSSLSEAVEDYNLKEKNIDPPCNCYENCEDDFADIMFKHFIPSKPKIEDLALIWENPPILSINDKRNIDGNLKSIDDSGMVNELFRSSSEDDFETMMDMEVSKVPPPFFLD